MALQVPPEELDPLTRIQWARDKVRQHDLLQPGTIKHRRKLPEQPMIRTQARDPQSDGPSVGDGKDGVGCVDPVLGQVRKDLIDRSASQFGRERVRRRTTGGEPLSLLPQACDAESLGVHEVLVMNEAVRSVAARPHTSASEIHEVAVREAELMPMYDDAIAKVKRGITDLAEALRHVRKH